MRNSPIFWAILSVALILMLSGSFFVVDQREKAVLFQFGELTSADYAPGLHLKVPVVQAVQKFDGRILTLDDERTENFLTIEKKNVEVDFYVKWRISDAAIYYRATGGQELVARDRLSSIVNRGLRDQFASRTIVQAVSAERADLTRQLELGDKVADLGIQIVDVRIKSINLPQAVSESVYERMRAERTRVASDLRARGAEEGEKIRAEADREAQITLANAYKAAETLKGEGDARAADIYGRAYGQDAEFYSFYRSLNLYRETFSGSSDVLVLEPKGELFRYFKGEGR